MNNNLVSIITPIYNSATWVDNLLKTVKEQTYQSWEMIIIDDCSTDNTFEVLNNIAKNDHRIKVYKNASNQGPGEHKE